MENYLLASLLNNIWALVGIILGVVIVASAILLYIFVFRAKVHKNIADHNEKVAKQKVEKAERNQKLDSFANNVFAERSADEKRKHDVEVEEVLSSRANVVGNTGAKAEKAKVEKPASKPKTSATKPSKK